MSGMGLPEEESTGGLGGMEAKVAMVVVVRVGWKGMKGQASEIGVVGNVPDPTTGGRAGSRAEGEWWVWVPMRQVAGAESC